MDNIPTEVYRDAQQIVQNHLMDMHEEVINELSDGGFFGDEALMIRLVRKLICENI